MTPVANSSRLSAPSRTIILPFWRSGVVGVLAVIVWVACLQTSDLNQSYAAGVVMKLPEKVGNFIGKDGEISEAERTLLPSDTEFARKVYKNPENVELMASIVLSGGEKRSIHRPEICLPGQGWTISSGGVIPVKLDNGNTIEIMKLDLVREVEIAPGKKSTLRSYYLYWFVGKDRSTPSHMDRIFTTSWDRVFGRVNHRWAYVIVTSLITDNIRVGGLNADETLSMLKKFIAEATPKFQISEMNLPISDAKMSVGR